MKIRPTSSSAGRRKRNAGHPAPRARRDGLALVAVGEAPGSGRDSRDGWPTVSDDPCSFAITR
jgi:hypothetical protein